MIWLFILKQWKGMVSGAMLVSVIAMIPIAILYSANKAQQGTIVRLEADVYATEIKLNTAIETRDAAKQSLEIKNKAVEMWMNKYRESNDRLAGLVQRVIENDKDEREALSEESIKASIAINRAETTEAATFAFADAVFGELHE